MAATRGRVAATVGLTAALILACADPRPLRIAVVGIEGTPLGAVLAVEDINASGGINGHLLEADVLDPPLPDNPQQAIATATRFADDVGILAVIGHGGSATSIAASQVYNARHLPQIAPTTSSPLYSKAGPYSFRMVASDQHQAEFIAKRVADGAGTKRVALLYVNDDYGRALHGFLLTELRGKGITTVYDAPFISGESFAHSVNDITRSLVAASPDLLIWIGLEPELKQLRPTLRAAMPQLRVFGSDGVSFIGAVTDSLAAFEGDWVVTFTDISADRPALRSVAERFLARNKRPLTDGAALTYDAVGILASIMRGGARNRESIQRVLQNWGETNHVYDGITGPISFDKDGDARAAYVLMRVTAHGLSPVLP